MDIATGLVHLAKLVEGVQARVSARHDLTPVQAKLLCHLLAGPRGMADLARALGVEKAALTGLADRVERRGLARRIPVPGDRRALRVELTDAGRAAAAAFHADITAELNGIVAALTPPELEAFRPALAKIVAMGEAATTRAPTEPADRRFCGQDGNGSGQPLPGQGIWLTG